jgi:hypothetical protein
VTPVSFLETSQQEDVTVYPKFLRLIVCLAIAAATLSACNAPGSVTAGAEPAASFSAATANGSLEELRQVTAKFQRFEYADSVGYSTKVTPCWGHHSAGAMGFHYGKMDLFDATADLLAPEVVMYEPQTGGFMKLVGMEYIVPIDAWKNAGHDVNDPNDRPELLGQKFTQHSFLPIYKLHIWLWRDNPQGTFADWNPKVSCDATSDKEIF